MLLTGEHRGDAVPGDSDYKDTIHLFGFTFQS